jgi:hypothetical protein
MDLVRRPCKKTVLQEKLTAPPHNARLRHMKTVIDTPDTLVLEETPWLFGLAIIAFVLIFAGVGWIMLVSGEIIGGLMFLVGGLGMGVLAFWAFIRRTQLWLDQPCAQIALRSRSLFGFSEQTFPLADLTGADTQTSHASKGQRTRRAVLRFGGRTNKVVAITSHYTSGRGPLRTAAAVNDWLSRNRGQHEGRP